MSGQICVDANLVVKLFTFEDYYDEAVALMDEADKLGIELIAPDAVFAETASTIRKLVYRKLLSAENGALAIGLLKRIDIKRYDTRDLYDEAWRIAEKHNLGGLYDAFYLALAELRQCDFWTADEKFINAVSGNSRVKNIKDFSAGILEKQ